MKLKVYAATIYQVREAIEAAENVQNFELTMALGIALKGLEYTVEAGEDTTEMVLS